MIDFKLGVSAIKELLHGLENMHQTQQYNAYTSIISLSKEIETIYTEQGIEDDFVNEQMSDLRTFAAHSAGLIDTGHPKSQCISWAYAALKLIVSGLERAGFDPVNK